MKKARLDVLVSMISTSLFHHCGTPAYNLKQIQFIHLIQSFRPNDKNGKAKSIYFTHAKICSKVKIHVILLLLSMYSKIYWSKRSVSDIEIKAFSTKLLSDENKFKKGNKRKEVVGINAKFVLLVI